MLKIAKIRLKNQRKRLFRQRKLALILEGKSRNEGYYSIKKYLIIKKFSILFNFDRIRFENLKIQSKNLN